MSVITDPATRRRLSALHAALTSATDLMAVARARHAELVERKAQLEQRQTDEERRTLPAASAPDSALAAALLDDPNAAIDGDALAAATESHKLAGAARAEQQARIAVVRSAIMKLEPLVTDASNHVSAAERQVQDADDELQRAAYVALTDEFRSRFQALVAEVVDPMVVLQGGMRGACTHLESDSRVTLRTWHPQEGGFGQYETELLLSDHPSHTERRRMGADGILAAFLAGLAARR